MSEVLFSVMFGFVAGVLVFNFSREVAYILFLVFSLFLFGESFIRLFKTFLNKIRSRKEKIREEIRRELEWVYKNKYDDHQKAIWLEYFDSLEEIEKWRKYTNKPSDAYLWRRFVKPEQIPQWIEVFGDDINVTSHWWCYFNGNLDKAKEWHNYFNDPYEAVKWANYFDDPALASKLRLTEDDPRVASLEIKEKDKNEKE